MNFFAKRKLNSLRKKVQKLHELAIQQGNVNSQEAIKAHYEVAKFYESYRFDRDLPNAEIYALETYRAAASLGDVEAEYICGERILQQAKFWDTWSNDPIYGSAIHKKYAAGFYEEAFAYLKAAEEHEYALAKRLIGMMYIHGWGVPKNTDKGFELVIQSIDVEKAWDRATKIFEELKLSSPEFFAALRTRQSQS